MFTIKRRIENLERRLPPAGAKRSHAMFIVRPDLSPDRIEAIINERRSELAAGAAIFVLPDNGRDGMLPDGKEYVIF